MDNTENKITMSYHYDDTDAVITFRIDNSLEEYVENFKRFLLACSFNPESVNDVRYGDEDICIIKDRIKSSLEILESLPNRDDDKIRTAIKYLDEAYDC